MEQGALFFDGNLDELHQNFIEMGFKEVSIKTGTMEEDSEEEDVCEICQSSEEANSILLECDECHSSFHLECLRLTEMPKEEWLCNACNKEERTIKKRKM